jgi:hypothetical protein
MDVVFSICTRSETKEHSKLPIECVKSIKAIYPEAEIFIVDSNSLYREHFSKLIELGCTISDLENLNYEAGAIWETFRKVDKSKYVFMQDSMVLLENIDEYLEKKFVTFGGIHANWILTTDQIYNWGKEKIQLSDYSFMDDGFNILQYSSMIISRDLLSKMKAKNFDKVLPTNKIGSYAMERLFGIVLKQEGIEISCENELPHTRIKKIWMDRQ